ncbi:uncharacterized protein LOC127806719 [Diospyros lotus]|uniref:uncharacterized protein LOC127806719 n=1 Tax=Diospyros lotus TaxID=55363 RepID=UPI0022572886|nr:uncharacterized protein LOC127806719 [Diospyros lotus]
MLVTERSSVISSYVFSCLVAKKNARKLRATALVAAQKRDLAENSGESKQQPGFPLMKVSSRKILSQTAVAVLGLGFVDAGYSGDWSRIGVISRETEDLLKLGAFFVVPLCIFLIFSFSKQNEA